MHVELRLQFPGSDRLDRQVLADYARSVVELSHPSLLRVFDVLTDEDGRWALVRQATCAEHWLAPSRAAPFTQVNAPLACSLVLTIAEGIAYLHRARFRGRMGLSWEETVLFDRDGERWFVGLLPPLPDEVALPEEPPISGVPGYIAPELRNYLKTHAGCVAGASGADARRGDASDATERIAEETQRGRRPAAAATRRDAATSGRRRCRTSSAMLSVASPPPCSSPAARIAGVAARVGFEIVSNHLAGAAYARKRLVHPWGHALRVPDWRQAGPLRRSQ